MVILGPNCVLIQFTDQIVLAVIRTQLLLVVLHVVNPSQFVQFDLIGVQVSPEICQWTHLSVHKRIPQHQLLILKQVVTTLSLATAVM